VTIVFADLRIDLFRATDIHSFDSLHSRFPIRVSPEDAPISDDTFQLNPDPFLSIRYNDYIIDVQNGSIVDLTEYGRVRGTSARLVESDVHAMARVNQ